MKRLFLPLLALMFTLACNISVQLTDVPPTPPPPLATVPVEPPVEPTPTQVAPAPTQAAPATNTPSTPPTATTLPPTAEPTATNPLIPSGFLVAVSDGNQINAYNAQGQMTGNFQTTGMTLPNDSDAAYVAGSSPEGVVSAPLIFQAFDDTSLIRMNTGGQLQTLLSNAELSYLAGARAQPIFAYATTTWTGNALVSHVYVRTITGGGASWALERSDPQSYAVQPLAMQAADGQPHGVWYSLMPWGIGGDIVFPPRKGLYYLDLTAGGTENLYLADDFSPQGLSPDLTWVAYMPAEFGFIEGGGANLTLYNLYSTASVNIPLRDGSNRGAGYVVFSPDNQRLAWMEGSGWMMAETPNFHAKVLIANINGNLLAELPDDRFDALTTSGDASWVQPVGWLDAETLVVEVRADDWNEVALARVRFDGSEISFLAQGQFAGFLYP